MKHRAPKSIDQGKALLERYAAVAAEIGVIAAARDEKIAAANQDADTQMLPLAQELDELAALLGPWWSTHKAALTGGKRKSAQLGGCEIGTRFTRPPLDFTGEDGEEEKALAALKAARWGKPFLKIKFYFDKFAIAKGLDDKHADKLRALGFSQGPGADALFIKAVGQTGAVDQLAA